MRYRRPLLLDLHSAYGNSTGISQLRRNPSRSDTKGENSGSEAVGAATTESSRLKTPDYGQVGNSTGLVQLLTPFLALSAPAVLTVRAVTARNTVGKSTSSCFYLAITFLISYCTRTVDYCIVCNFILSIFQFLPFNRSYRTYQIFPRYFSFAYPLLVLETKALIISLDIKIKTNTNCIFKKSQVGSSLLNSSPKTTTKKSPHREERRDCMRCACLNRELMIYATAPYFYSILKSTSNSLQWFCVAVFPKLEEQNLLHKG